MSRRREALEPQGPSEAPGDVLRMMVEPEALKEDLEGEVKGSPDQNRTRTEPNK